MFEVAYISVLSVIAFIAPIVGIMLVLLAMQFTKNRKTGFLHFAPYAILLVTAADTLFSNRSLDNIYQVLTSSLGRGAVNTWLVRGISVFLLLASLERIASGIKKNGHVFGSMPVLTSTFIMFWLGSVGLTMLLSAHPYFSHENLYSLIIGMGVLSLSKNESVKFIYSFRNSLIVFLTLGALWVAINPSLVMERNYIQGFFSGLPRYAGLSAGAISQGYLASLLILMLYVIPLKNSFFNLLFYALAGAIVFMAQSKTSWITTIVCLGILAWIKYVLLVEIGTNQKTKVSKATTVVITCILFATVAAGLIFIFSDVGSRVDRFIMSDEGQQLSSFTGRDVIWDFAISEWKNSPIFGYGPEFLGFDQRNAIGLPNATHAHNQFIDLLARSGLVGLLTMLIYLAAIIHSIFKKGNQLKSLALVFFLGLMFRAVSEVPFTLYGYGVEMLAHFALLALLVSQREQRIFKYPSNPRPTE